jgi:hypothetical protein
MTAAPEDLELTLARIEDILHEDLLDIKNFLFTIGNRMAALEAKIEAAQTGDK